MKLKSKHNTINIMVRKYTEHSYQLIQTWLKEKYAKDPEFRRTRIEKASIYQYMAKYRKLVDITLLENYANTFKNEKV
jgi:hypothetical protein